MSYESSGYHSKGHASHGGGGWDEGHHEPHGHGPEISHGDYGHGGGGGGELNKVLKRESQSHTRIRRGGISIVLHFLWQRQLFIHGWRAII